VSATPRLGLPFLSAGQAQKELFHNEALQLLDLAVAPAVEEPPRGVPPQAPTAGSSYVVAADATGEWAGRDNSIAGYSSGGWRFVTPPDGMNVFVRSAGVWACYRSGTWELGTVRGSSVLVDGEQVVGSRAASIPSPSGGSTVDSEARSAVIQILSALRGHGLIES
jgi:hypothetical protein